MTQVSRQKYFSFEQLWPIFKPSGRSARETQLLKKMYTLEQLSNSQVVGFWSRPAASLAQVNPDAYNAALADAPRVEGIGFCSHCGRDIAHNVIIRDFRGKLQVIGETCAEKVGISPAEIEAAKEERREAAEAARWARQQAEADSSVFTSGKYAGQKIADVLASDERYCLWFEDNFGGQRSANGIAAKTIANLLAPARAEAAAEAAARAEQHAELLAELRSVRVLVTQVEQNGRWYPLANPYHRDSKSCAELANAIERGCAPAGWVVEAAAKDLAKAAGIGRARKAKDAFIAAFYARLPSFING